jgi:hypothetical protein
VGHRRLLLTLTAGSVIALGLAGVAPAALAASATPALPHAAGQATGAAARAAAVARKDNPFCQRLAAKRIQASSGANMYCFGAQLQQGSAARSAQIFAPGAPANVDAASPAEDISPAGVAAQGQSETSVGAIGQYVVEAWNDATGFVSTCGAPMFKEEGTGLGFSVNGGRSFRDLGGLRNPHCQNYIYEGDPSVAAYRVGGHDYFYISSLYDPLSGIGPSKIAFDACQVIGSGTAARLACGRPVIAGTSTECLIPTPTLPEFCSFTDKDFLTIDPARGRLYVTYSDFVLTGSGGNPEIMSVCDLGSHTGGRGPAGGTPAAPVCEKGTPLKPVSATLLRGRPYFRVAMADPLGCENEGAYPAADVATGAVYVGYEYNLFTSLFLPQCMTAATPVQNVLAKVPPRCLTLTATSPCFHPSRTAAVRVVSMEVVLVPGYNRSPSNDFPRLAVSDRFNTVSMVWNDARHHPFGDILMQSFGLVALHPVQARPLVLDWPHGGGLSYLPALRTATARGLLDVSWYTRSSVATVNTGVAAALNVNPRASATPANVQIANRLSNWLANSSIIVPNFGDYTDAAVSVTGSPPYLGHTLYIAWSDGRLGIPQPFEAHLPAG